MVCQLQYGCFCDETNKTLHFTLFSAHAAHVELCLFAEPIGASEFKRFEMIGNNSGKWELTLSTSYLAPRAEVLYYGYRLWGPNWEYDPRWIPGSSYGFITDCDEFGNRFNPNKLLIDPWSTEISHNPKPRFSTIDPNEYDDIYYSGERYRMIDSAKSAPKSMFIMHRHPVKTGAKPRRLLKDDIIYEVHLRGFTRQDTSLPENIRGTYKGAGLKARYCKDLGITAIELLPVQQFADEQNDDNDPRGDNYWGYMTLGYFAPNRRYSFDKMPGGPTTEFKEMVRAFHDVGIKVFLDVVFNHTGEGLLRRANEDDESRDDDYQQFPQFASLLSFRGIDNASYYTLRSSNADHGIPNQRYQDNSGCGGNLNVTSPVVHSLILDSLSYWSDEMGIDGFRFDLAPVLGNVMSSDLFHFDIGDPDNLLNIITRQIPVRTSSNMDGIDLIAEPWATGSGNIYQLGQFPDGWAEWNDVYRKTVRRFENKLTIYDLPPHDLANIIAGSDHEFRHNSLRKEPCPWNSINYIASHDGYSLRDVFSYTGTEDTWDHNGSPPEQRKAVRNAIALLMTSAGVPMFCGGDELYRTQEGHINSAMLDNSTQHLDWNFFNRYACAVRNDQIELVESLRNCVEIRLYRFTTAMIALRNRFGSLRPESYFTGIDISGKGLKDIMWYRSDGHEMVGTDWDMSRFLAWRIDNQEYVKHGDIGSLYIAYNWDDAPVHCCLPLPIRGMQWYRYVDTAEWFEYAANYDGDHAILDKSYDIHGRSVLVIFEQ